MKKISLKMIGVQDMFVRLAKDANLPENIKVGFDNIGPSLKSFPGLRPVADNLRVRATRLNKAIDNLMNALGETESLKGMRDVVEKVATISDEKIARDLPKVPGYTKSDIMDNSPVTESRDQIINKIGQPAVFKIIRN